jgi:hypothetical protein
MGYQKQAFTLEFAFCEPLGCRQGGSLVLGCPAAAFLAVLLDRGSAIAPDVRRSSGIGLGS